MIRESNSLLKLAEKDIEVSQMILQSSNDELLQNIAAYHTQQSTIRYNSNFKTNRDFIESFNEEIIRWIGRLKER